MCELCPLTRSAAAAADQLIAVSCRVNEWSNGAIEGGRGGRSEGGGGRGRLIVVTRRRADDVAFKKPPRQLSNRQQVCIPH